MARTKKQLKQDLHKKLKQHSLGPPKVNAVHRGRSVTGALTASGPYPGAKYLAGRTAKERGGRKAPSGGRVAIESRMKNLANSNVEKAQQIASLKDSKSKFEKVRGEAMKQLQGQYKERSGARQNKSRIETAVAYLKKKKEEEAKKSKYANS